MQEEFEILSTVTPMGDMRFRFRRWRTRAVLMHALTAWRNVTRPPGLRREYMVRDEDDSMYVFDDEMRAHGLAHLLSRKAMSNHLGDVISLEITYQENGVADYSVIVRNRFLVVSWPRVAHVLRVVPVIRVL